MHVITEVLVVINLLDGPTFSVKLVKTTKPMVTKSLHFCFHWDFQLVLYLNFSISENIKKM